MNGIRKFFSAIVIGTLLLGPAVYYAGTIVTFGLGFHSSYALTRYATLTLFYGAIIGFIAALICGVARCCPRVSALWSGVAYLIVAGAAQFWQAMQGLIEAHIFRGLVGHLIVLSLASALMGYLIAILTNMLEEKRQRSADSAPSFSRAQSESRTYVLK